MRMIVARTADVAKQLGERPFIAVVDREANILAAYQMQPSRPPIVLHENVLFGAIVRARTAAMFSTTANAFTSLTACWITREHYPPSSSNTAGGPLYGVVFSQVGGSDIQPNNGTNYVLAPGNNQPGLTGAPGGVPIYKNGIPVGALGMAFCSDDLQIDINSPSLAQCSGAYQSERIARAALASLGYEAPTAIRADQIFNDGVQLLYSNESLWPVNLAKTLAALRFTLTPDSLLSYGNFDARFPLRSSLPRFYPNDDYVPGYVPRSGVLLSAAQVTAILQNAVAGARGVRSEIRRPLGQSARVTIAVSDTNGAILGMYRMGDAPIFGVDVSAQKARTAVAFNDTSRALCRLLRNVLLSGGTIMPNTVFAASTRTVSFLAQAYYPPGIESSGKRGPLYLDREFSWQASLGTQPFGNGITIFPGGVPLYVNGVLVGGIGVSGDGVNQDDFIASAGAAGYMPPQAIKADNFSYGGVQLPYVKFPRQP